MTEPGLRLDRLTRRPGVIDLLDRIDPSGAVSVLATGGKVVRGGATGPGAGASVPILVGGIEVGSVAGEGDRVSLVAEVLERLGEAEVERRAMADEVLALYREVNLLYALVERFAGLDDRRALAERALLEVTRLVPADGGTVVVVDGGTVTVAAATGVALAEPPRALARARVEQMGTDGLLVAPMVIDEVERGAIVLVRASQPFSAAELKLVCAVASQAAAFLERVLDGERRRAEAEQREARLRRQIDELRIELDDRRQAENVRRVTDTDYFADLREQADRLRDLVDGRTDDPA